MSMKEGVGQKGVKNGMFNDAAPLIRHKKTTPRSIKPALKGTPRPKSNGAFNSGGK